MFQHFFSLVKENTMEKQLLFVINPKAGRAEIKNYTLESIETFVKNGFVVTVFTTQKSGDAFDFVKNNGERFSRIVCCGGDGTADEVLNGIMSLDKRPEFSVIPAGTTNDYAYNLNIPSVIPEAATIAATGEPFKIDVGRFDERYFTYVAAFGVFTEVTYETPQDSKNLFGYIAYVLEGAKRLSSIKTYHAKVEYDGGVIEDDFFVGLCTNSVSLAGLRTAVSGSELDDGILETVLIKAPKTLVDLQSIINILISIEHLTDIKGDFIEVVRTNKVTISSETPIAWTVDGENGGKHLKVTIENVHKAITVIRGTKKLN